MTDATLSPPQVLEHEPVLSREPPHPTGEGWTRAWIVCGVVALATWASLALTRVEGGVAAMWIANGLVVAACLVAPRGQWPRLLVLATAGMIAVRLGHGDGWAPSLALTAVNLVEIATVVVTVRSRVPDVGAGDVLRPLATTATVATVAACLASAGLASVILYLLEGAPPALTGATWFVAHLLGMVIVGTVGVTALHLGWRVLGRPGRRRDHAACVAALLLTCIVVGWQSWLPVLFVVYLPLLVLIYRHGFTGVVSGSIVLAVAGGISAAYDLGSFAMIPDADVAKRALLLQLFVGVGCLLSYPLAVGLSERRRMMRELAASEARLRAGEAQLQAITDNVPAMIAHFDAGERFTYANRTVERVFGIDGDALLGATLRDVRGDIPYAELADHVQAVLRGQRQAFEGRVEIGGRPVDHRTQFVPDVDADGTVHGFYSITFDITALKDAERALAQLARVDPLTGLANRRRFEERLPEALARAQRAGRPLGLLVLDLDRFKAINDTHGHAAGDAVLKAFAERIGSCVYEVDLPARLGGDEFVVLLEGDTDEETATRVAQRIVEAMREPVAIDGAVLALSTSIGVGVHFPARDTATLLRLADEALYDAKAAGRDGWRVRTG